MKRGLLLAFAVLATHFSIVAQTAQALPFSQNWTTTTLITVDDNWSGVPGIVGFRGDNITAATAVDPQTLLADDSPGVIDVIANQANPNTNSSGGVAEFDGIANPAVAMQGSGTADAPYLLIAVITTGKQNITVAYNVRDLDGSTDNAIQPVALQYRVGTTGAFTNVPTGFVADGTTGPSLATQVTAVNVTLPAACNNQAVVQLRIMTANAAGNDEWVGIDDIVIDGTTISSCNLASAGLTDVHCENNAETPSTTDDYIWFQLQPTGTGLGTGYNVTVNVGSVTLGSASPATNVPYGNSEFFRLQAGSAGGGNVIATITDATTGSTCNILVTIVDPGACSQGADPCIPDVTPPSITCPGNTSVSCSGNVPVSDITAPTASDLCGDVTISFIGDVTSNQTCANRFTVTRTYRATDEDDNTADCVQTITVNDQTPPSLTCPTGVTVSCSSDVPANNTSLVTGLSDNCGGATPTVSFVGDVVGNQTCANKFTVTRTYRATDACGNSATCSQVITVNDQTAPTFNQSPLPANQTISCTTSLPLPEMLTGTDNCGGSGMIPNVIWVNELHYDNVGTDVGEFVEVAGTAGLNLADYQLVLYNGNGGVVYNTINLTGAIDNEGGSGFGAVSFSFPTDGLQNGTPDGLALVQISNNMVIQYLSYEGPFQATNGPANGIIATDIGVSETTATPIGSSLSLSGTATGYAGFTWGVTATNSAGTLNPGQTIQQLPVAIPATFSQTETPGNCPGARTVTRTWTVSDICGNAVSHTQVISVFDNVAPVLTPTPANITISCSDPIPAVPTVIATDACDPNGVINGPVWINEIHYDNAGLDVGEFVEIAGRAGTNLAGYALFFYNGSTGNMGGTYTSLQLSGIIPNQSNGFGTIVFNMVNPTTPLVIENGPSDGIAFVQGATVLQFLSYEGVMTAIGGPANGLTTTDIGVSENGSDPAGLSLRLSGNGATYAAFIWNAASAANPNTPGAVNQGQTFPAQPPVGLPVTFTTSTTPSATCPQASTITRTWSTLDGCGNTFAYTQTISIVDNTAPVVTCPATVNVSLSINGTVTVSAATLGSTALDNCSPTNAIQFVSAPVTLTCANQGTTVPYISQAKDQCGNIGVCTTQVVVAPFQRCVPKILITDPCVCKNNATTLTNGQFGETIKVESITGKIWTITAISGLYSSTSNPPPSAPTPIALGTTFVENPANSGDYYLTGLHVDDLGYSITVTSQAGEVLTIGNSCKYPNPAITSDLTGPFCLYSDPVALTGTPGDNNIVSQGFTVNGVAATSFNPGAGVGQYTIVYTVDGGTPKATDPSDPGCVQTVTQIVNVVATPSQLTCNDLVYVSLDVDCITEVQPDDILEGTYGCFDDYTVTITGLSGTPVYGNTVTVANLGQTLKATVKHLVSGVTCWGLIKVEDKLAPVIQCTDITLTCANTTYDPEYLKNSLGLTTAYPLVSDCSGFTLSYVETWHDLTCGQSINGQSDMSAYVVRKWTAKDGYNNTSTCTQNIYFKRKHIADLVLPADVTVQCSANVNADPSVTGAPYFNAFNQKWTIYPNFAFCELQATYVDQILPVCDGTYKIIRTWTLVDWCLPFTPTPPTTNPLYHTQVIKVVDEQGPTMTCPANTTVSTDPFNCCATTNLPDLIITDNCSRINNIEADIITFDQYTGAQTAILEAGGTLKDFPGNNYWNRDTLADWGFTPCLPLGTHTVIYYAQDDCGNTSTCSFKLKVDDQIPPVAACTQTTQVALGGNGQILVNAETFDQGSYDNCGTVNFKVRRMNSSSCQSNGSFYDQVKFCCSDINQTIQVVLRVYDVAMPNGDVSLTAQEENSNDCMIQVLVEDKIKPVCNAPANVTVSCENFDPSLVAYGKGTATDNCCVDKVTTTNSYTLFDTVCNRGTIIRTFRAFDCATNSSQCTQRIIVDYEQDYFVKFPNDVIVTVCDGTGNYGEPTFFGEDCELLASSYTDEIFTVVPDACFKIERSWKVINWCTYNPNAGCIYVPNPTPNATVNHPSNLPGPIVSAAGTIAPWNPTVVKINSTDPQATNYSTFYDPNANCYEYKQIIKIIDTKAPVATCPISPVIFCDVTPNNAELWNGSDWWDNTIQSHNLCEGPSELTVTASDACSGANINIEYLLFLDLDGNGSMETVVSSTNLPGWNNVNFNNSTNPNFGGGISRTFDERAVPFNQKYGFAIQETVSGQNKTAAVRWNTQQSQTSYTVPELPYGTHKIKWVISDGCGNESVCEYTFVVKDCKKPTVVCLNGLSVNIMPTQMIQLWASDFLQYTDDNCTPAGQIKIGIVKSSESTGVFPVDANGNPITNVVFTCAELGTQPVQLWAIDAAGNADYCETYVIVQDNAGNCGQKATIAGALKTEANNGLEDASVDLQGSMPGVPPMSMFNHTDNQGKYEFFNAVPFAANVTVTPIEDDNHINGVSTFDLVLISKHILGLEPMTSPFQMIAADANKSGSITTFDIVELRKLILGVYTELPNNTSWRFVDKSFTFPNTANPFQTAFPENKTIAAITGNQNNGDFTAIKVGDINGNAIANNLMSTEDRSSSTLLFDVQDRTVKAGEIFEVSFKSAELVKGYQFTMNFPGLDVMDVLPGANMTMDNFGVFAADKALTTSFDADARGEFTVRFRAAQSGMLSNLLAVSSRITKAEAYSLPVGEGRGGALDVAFRFNGEHGTTVTGVGFELYQNQPNPFVNKTAIGFHLPEAATATLTVYDETGRTLFTQKGDFAKGYNQIAIDRALLNTTGMMYYKLETATDSATKKMIQSRN